MLDQKEWSVEVAPHIRDEESTPRIMWSVVAALVPAGAWSFFLFGPALLYVIALSIGTCLITEWLILRLRGRRATLGDGSAVVTGLLLAYILPSHSIITVEGHSELGLLAWQIPIVGAIVAIAVGKHCFGGLGFNIWNPALVGRAFVQMGFASQVSLARWPWPVGAPDAVTQATPLSRGHAPIYSMGEMIMGFHPGSLGEVSGLFLLLGALFLILRRYINWRLPLGYILALLVFAALLAWSPRQGMPNWVSHFADAFLAFRQGRIGPGNFLDQLGVFSLMQIFSGGLILGAFFMATDMVTSPYSNSGQFIFGIGCGLLTALLRSFSHFPEGVCYSILLMNTIRPYIDGLTRQRIIGEPRRMWAGEIGG